MVAVVGTLLIGVAAGTAGASAAGSPGPGVVLVLVSAIVYAVALVAQKVVLRRLSGLLVTWAACTVGFVACLPFARQLVTELAAAPPRVWWAVVYLGVVPTAIAMGWLFLGEVPLLLAVVGGAVSLVGVGISRRR